MTPGALIKSLEGCEFSAYPDPASARAKHRRATGMDDPSLDGRPWTIGYGHTGQGIREGLIWTIEQAQSQLEHDLLAFGSVIRSLVNVPLTESQEAALVSFAYNEGSHRLSDPACRIVPLLNAGDYYSAAGQFMHWTMAGGQRILISRRMAEIVCFLEGMI